MKMWQAHKLTHDLAMKELYRTRGPASLRYVENIMRVQQYEREMAELEEQRKVAKMLQKGLRPRIQHPHVEEWKAQYEPQWYGVSRRFKFLLLRGCSRAGKTVFAENLWGEENTVIGRGRVSAQTSPRFDTWSIQSICALFSTRFITLQSCTTRHFFRQGSTSWSSLRASVGTIATACFHIRLL